MIEYKFTFGPDQSTSKLKDFLKDNPIARKNLQGFLMWMNIPISLNVFLYSKECAANRLEAIRCLGC
jgi:hypothetical protein